jgi:hypothetical protein
MRRNEFNLGVAVSQSSSSASASTSASAAAAAAIITPGHSSEIEGKIRNQKMSSVTLPSTKPTMNFSNSNAASTTSGMTYRQLLTSNQDDTIASQLLPNANLQMSFQEVPSHSKSKGNTNMMKTTDTPQQIFEIPTTVEAVGYGFIKIKNPEGTTGTIWQPGLTHLTQTDTVFVNVDHIKIVLTEECTYTNIILEDMRIFFKSCYVNGDQVFKAIAEAKKRN